MTFQSTKTYGHQVGLSCCFRQHKAVSHCRHLHGYALSVKFVFETETLDAGWVVDFGGMKGLKAMLEDSFDHRLLVAEDDPRKDEICALAGIDAASVLVVAATGCEAFAAMVYEFTHLWLQASGYAPRCRLVSVEVSEHGANSALYLPSKESSYGKG